MASSPLPRAILERMRLVMVFGIRSIGILCSEYRVPIYDRQHYPGTCPEGRFPVTCLHPASFFASRLQGCVLFFDWCSGGGGDEKRNGILPDGIDDRARPDRDHSG